MNHIYILAQKDINLSMCCPKEQHFMYPVAPPLNLFSMNQSQKKDYIENQKPKSRLTCLVAPIPQEEEKKTKKKIKKKLKKKEPNTYV